MYPEVSHECRFIRIPHHWPWWRSSAINCQATSCCHRSEDTKRTSYHTNIEQQGSIGVICGVVYSTNCERSKFAFARKVRRPGFDLDFNLILRRSLLQPNMNRLLKLIWSSALFCIYHNQLMWHDGVRRMLQQKHGNKARQCTLSPPGEIKWWSVWDRMQDPTDPAQPLQSTGYEKRSKETSWGNRGRRRTSTWASMAPCDGSYLEAVPQTRIWRRTLAHRLAVSSNGWQFLQSRSLDISALAKSHDSPRGDIDIYPQLEYYWWTT